MDMHVPDAPASLMTGDALQSGRRSVSQDRPEILIAGSNLPIKRPNKRRRGEDSVDISASKIRETRSAWASRAEPSEDLKRGVHEAEDLPETVDPDLAADNTIAFDIIRVPSPPKSSERSIAPGLRHTQIRNVIQYVVNEGLKVGGRPESAIAKESETGEIIEVKAQGPNGDLQTTNIEWSVDSDVPATIFGT